MILQPISMHDLSDEKCTELMILWINNKLKGLDVYTEPLPNDVWKTILEYGVYENIKKKAKISHQKIYKNIVRKTEDYLWTTMEIYCVWQVFSIIIKVLFLVLFWLCLLLMFFLVVL